MQHFCDATRTCKHRHRLQFVNRNGLLSFLMGNKEKKKKKGSVLNVKENLMSRGNELSGESGDDSSTSF